MADLISALAAARIFLQLRRLHTSSLESPVEEGTDFSEQSMQSKKWINYSSDLFLRCLSPYCLPEREFGGGSALDTPGTAGVQCGAGEGGVACGERSARAAEAPGWAAPGPGG